MIFKDKVLHTFHIWKYVIVTSTNDNLPMYYVNLMMIGFRLTSLNSNALHHLQSKA